MLGKTQLLEKYTGQRVRCSLWTRVMQPCPLGFGLGGMKDRGYYRPAVLIDRSNGKEEVGSSFNPGKRGEYFQRVWFQTQKSMGSH